MAYWPFVNSSGFARGGLSLSGGFVHAGWAFGNAHFAAAAVAMISDSCSAKNVPGMQCA